MGGFPPSTFSHSPDQQVYVALSVLLFLVMLAAMWKFHRGAGRVFSYPVCGLMPLAVFALFAFGSTTELRSDIQGQIFALHSASCLAMFSMAVYRKWGEALAGGGVVWLLLACLISMEIANARYAARRSHCNYNLKQLGIAIHNSDEEGDFRPSVGTPARSWRVQILPFLEAAELGHGYDDTQPWNTAANRIVGAREATPYRCPFHRIDRMRDGFASTDYALVTGPGTLFPTPDTTLDLQAIGDGTSHTILVAECGGLRIPWTEPRDVDVSRERMTLNELGPDGGSPSILSAWDATTRRSSHCIHIAMADGSVRTLDPNTTDPELVRKLTTANGGEPVDDF